jgi:hypothetical protein
LTLGAKNFIRSLVLPDIERYFSLGNHSSSGSIVKKIASGWTLFKGYGKHALLVFRGSGKIKTK